MGHRWDTVRTEAFSDGVFAIAITLLVLDIRVPESGFENLWRGILEAWPSYLGYATSFITIGGIWLAHHSLFGRLQYVNTRVMRINLVLLMAVSFLPFPTRLMAEAMSSDDAERAAVIFYGTALLAISVLIGALWATAASDRALLRREVSEEEVNAILRATSPNVGGYVGVIVMAILFPRVAAVGFLVIAVALVLTARGDSTSRATPESA